MYDPTIGKWTTQDPIGFDAGDANLFRYVANNPINETDPSGTEEIKFDPAKQLPTEKDGKPVNLDSTKKGEWQLIVQDSKGLKLIWYADVDIQGILQTKEGKQTRFGACVFGAGHNNLSTFRDNEGKGRLLTVYWFNYQVKGMNEDLGKDVEKKLKELQSENKDDIPGFESAVKKYFENTAGTTLAEDDKAAHKGYYKILEYVWNAVSDPPSAKVYGLKIKGKGGKPEWVEDPAYKPTGELK